MNLGPIPSTFLNRVYPPVSGATGHVLANLAEEVTREGGKVHILTSRADKTLAKSECVGGIDITRVPSMAFTRASIAKRALSYLSLYPAFLISGLRLPKGGVLVTMTDPPLLLVLGPILKWFKGCRTLHWAQDLYPEVAEELGVIRRNGLLAKLLRGFSTWALKRHDGIIAIGSCMKQRLMDRGIPENRITVIPNWNLSAAIDPKEDGQAFRRDQGWNDRFVVMYSGNFGLAHPFEGIVGAVRELEKTDPRILFAFIGGGPRLATLKDELEGRTNAVWLPSQPVERLAASLRAGDVHLASMYESACGLVVPSKVYGIVAAERPCIFLGPAECEAALLLTKTGAGRVLPSQDAAGLIQLLRELAGSNGESQVGEMRARARELAPTLGVKHATQAFKRALWGM